MSRQRQLNALLFELQTARSPLDRARILARAWRSVRDLTAGDRRLLARYAAFDGAEELFENLARRSGGTAPALLLRALSSVEQDDGGAVARLVAGLRRGAPVSEVAVEAVEAAAELVAEEAPQETALAASPVALGSRDHDAGEVEAVTAAMAALSDVGRQVAASAVSPAEGEPSSSTEGNVPETVADAREAAAARHRVSGVLAGVAEGSPPVPKVALMAGWDEFARPTVPDVPALAGADPSPVDAGQPRGAPADGLRPETESLLARFARLGSRLESRPGMPALRSLALSFPDGWQRRRAVSRLLESGAAPSVEGSLELVATLERERDRRWCLGVLLDRYPVSPAVLAELLEEVASPIARRRFSARARSG